MIAISLVMQLLMRVADMGIKGRSNHRSRFHDPMVLQPGQRHHHNLNLDMFLGLGQTSHLHLQNWTCLTGERFLSARIASVWAVSQKTSLPCWHQWRLRMMPLQHTTKIFLWQQCLNDFAVSLESLAPTLQEPPVQAQVSFINVAVGCVSFFRVVFSPAILLETLTIAVSAPYPICHTSYVQLVSFALFASTTSGSCLEKIHRRFATMLSITLCLPGPITMLEDSKTSKAWHDMPGRHCMCTMSWSFLFSSKLSLCRSTVVMVVL